VEYTFTAHVTIIRMLGSEIVFWFTHQRGSSLR
jgi:hypothetical protein